MNVDTANGKWQLNKIFHKLQVCRALRKRLEETSSSIRKAEVHYWLLG